MARTMSDGTGRNEIGTADPAGPLSLDMADLLSARSLLPAEEPPTPLIQASRIRRLLRLGVVVAPPVAAYFLFWELELYVLALIAAWIPAHIVSELRA